MFLESLSTLQIKLACAAPTRLGPNPSLHIVPVREDRFEQFDLLESQTRSGGDGFAEFQVLVGIFVAGGPCGVGAAATVSSFAWSVASMDCVSRSACSVSL